MTDADEQFEATEATSHEVDLTPIPLLCRFGFHNWTKWKSAKLTYASSDVWVSGQHRECLGCGKTEARQVW